MTDNCLVYELYFSMSFLNDSFAEKEKQCENNKVITYHFL